MRVFFLNSILMLLFGYSFGQAPLGMQWKELGPKNYGGRCRTLLIDRQNPDKMFAGGITGGLFVSLDGGNSWQAHPFNYQALYPGVSALAQAANGDIYLATGEMQVSIAVNTFSYIGFAGSGIYKSFDGGQTFVTLTATNSSGTINDPWIAIAELAIHPTDAQKIWAATRGGLKSSFDGGQTWSDAAGIGSADLYKSAFDVIVSGNTVHACIGNSYYRSTDGINFTKQNGVNGFPNSFGTFKMSASPQDSNYVYAILSKASGTDATLGVYRSVDNGNSWSAISPVSSSSFNPLGEQGYWNIAIAVDPSDKNHILVGGQNEVWDWDGSNWLMKIYTTVSSRNYDFQNVHEIVFKPSDPKVIYYGCDVGIFKNPDINLPNPVLDTLNTGFNTTMAFNISAMVNERMMMSAVDVGTVEISMQGEIPFSAQRTHSWWWMGPPEISTLNPNVTFVSSNGGELERSFDGVTFDCLFDNNIDRDYDCVVDQATSYIMPYILWESKDSSYSYFTDSVALSADTSLIRNSRSGYAIQRSYMVIGANTRIWFTPNATDSISSPKWYSIPISGIGTKAMEFSKDGSALFVGTYNGNLYRIEGIHDKVRFEDTLITVSYDTFPGTTTRVVATIDTLFHAVPDFPDTSRNWVWTSGATYQGITRTQVASATNWGANRYISDIAIHPIDFNQVIVTLGNYGSGAYVYSTSDALNQTPSWTSIQNNLPPFPVHDVLIDSYNPDNILLGTDIGIWESSDAGNNWAYQETEFTHVPVLRLREEPYLSKDCRAIYAATHGRGLFMSTSLIPTNLGCNTAVAIGEVRDDLLRKDMGKIRFYPNPASTSGVVEVYLKSQSQIKIFLTDILGKRITLNYFSDELPAGKNQLPLDFTGVEAGIYLLTVTTPEQIKSERIVIVRL